MTPQLGDPPHPMRKGRGRAGSLLIPSSCVPGGQLGTSEACSSATGSPCTYVFLSLDPPHGVRAVRYALVLIRRGCDIHHDNYVRTGPQPLLLRFVGWKMRVDARCESGAEDDGRAGRAREVPSALVFRSANISAYDVVRRLALLRITGSPHTRASAPLCIPIAPKSTGPLMQNQGIDVHPPAGNHTIPHREEHREERTRRRAPSHPAGMRRPSRDPP
ncbi:hypothetical protein HYPSUDRAFT_1053290 [Hypholoma sublateritium FD-334 SS-4]|uniref:Uncharacterized protein n=1 Tax=Hypholoma sublateritium (strain FD-334 SS-4) TaxID=945553 RepID=A0A0D2KQI5_HYPSF|nr:hypothetical protein HYPSUDRAFT_1053290 [Hypholoma sublateritium FD-334 SS-4]